MSCAPCTPCTPPTLCQPDNFGLLFPSLVGPMGPPGGALTYVTSLELLRALDPSEWTDGYQAYVGGYAEVADGGGGVFTYVSTSNEADNDGTIVEPSTGIGRWYRVYSGPLNARWFGATGDGTTDDTDAIQAALDQAADGNGATTVQGGAVFIPAGIYVVSSLTMERGVTLFGEGLTQTILRRTDTTGYGILFDSTGLTVNAVQDTVTIRDLSLVQAGTATAGGGIYANGVTSPAQLIIENVRIQDAYRGLLTTNTEGSYVNNVTVVDAIVDGFYFTGGFRGQTTVACKAQGCGSSGFSLSGGTSSNFFNCRSDDNTTNGFYAINTNYCGFYSCSNEGNVVGLYMTTCAGNVVDTFFTYVQSNTDHAVLLDGSDSNELRNLASNHQNAAYGTYMVNSVNSSFDNIITIGFLSNAWPSGITNAPGDFNLILTGGVATWNAEQVFTNARINAENLPTSDPGVTGDLWNNSGVVEVSP